MENLQIIYLCVGIIVPILLLFGGMKKYLDKKFEKIDQRFEKIDQRFNKLEEKLNSLEGRIIAIETTLRMRDFCSLRNSDNLGKAE